MKKLFTLVVLVTSLTLTVAKASYTQPSSVYLCSGSHSNAVFSVVPYFGKYFDFQWQVSIDNGASYLDMIDGTYVVGSSTPTMTLKPPVAGWSKPAFTPRYRCIITDIGGGHSTSSYATLNITNTITIYSQPTMPTAPCSGSTINLTVGARGAGLTYQWKRIYDGITYVIGGATSSTYSYTASYPSTYPSYYCTVTSSCGTSVSTNIVDEPTIQESPKITVQPANTSVCNGSSTSMSVTATSSGTLNYNWRKNYTPLAPQVTTSILSINPASAANAGNYDVIVGHSKNTCTVTSSIATLSVNNNDITQQPIDQTSGNGGTVTFQVTAGSGSTYQWQLSTNGGTSWSNITNAGIYSGATTNQLVLTAVTISEDLYKYRCNVSAAPCATKTSSVATLHVNSFPAFTAQPINDTLCSGNATFAVTANSVISYAWEVSTNGTSWTPIVGATSTTLTITAPGASMNGYMYHCIATNGNGSVTSAVCTLFVYTAINVSAQPTDLNKCLGDNASLTTTASGTGISYQWYKNTVLQNSKTASTLSYTNLDTTFSGLYYCKLTNFCGTKYTDTVSLVVNTPVSPNYLGPDTTICWKTKVTLDPGARFKSYSWNTGATTRTVQADSSITYIVNVTDSNNCHDAASRNFNVLKPWDSTRICLVTLDPVKNKNKIIWNKTSNRRTVSYNIYRQEGASMQLVGNVKYDSLSVFNDMASSPDTKVSRYTIKAVDSCGNESKASPYHETILLLPNISTVPTEANLSWNKYIDESNSFIPAYYYIYKGTTKTSMVLYDSVSGALATAYVDKSFNKIAYYQIVFKKSCAPLTILKSESGPYAQSLSNIVEYKTAGFETITELPVSVYPNPFSESLTISLSLEEASNVKIEVINSLGEKTAEFNYDMISGRQDIAIPASKLNVAKGICYLKIFAGDKMSVIKCSYN